MIIIGQSQEFLNSHDHPSLMANKTGKFNLNGYIMIYCPKHHFAQNGCIREHRLVYEQYYKCTLLPSAHVHHKNGNRQDNRIENLEALTSSQHRSLHNIGNKIWIGKKHSEESKRKNSDWHKGKKLSKETKLKLSKIHRLRNKERRANGLIWNGRKWMVA